MRHRTGAIAFLAAVAWSLPAAAVENDYLGLLRARDLTIFGSLLRPAARWR
jgi:hypothetical protein